ncbi:glycosyltransferase family 2 protein [Litoribacter populi]|uniref:glycosyltransferase family 2 protein n=1 Tax=Litoribacter populi TaxID=2598460 RepID=UPI00117C66DB|nr:glycosyltransferase family 2 protein [Litoribacter populi]
MQLISKVKIYSIIVTYNPDLSKLDNSVMRLISAGCYKVIIVNNSSYPLNLKKDSITVINLMQNLGIGKAQNIGMEMAYSEGADFFLHMDQDSLIDPNMINRLLSSYFFLQNKGYLIGLIGPVDYDIDSLKPSIPKFNKGKMIEKDLISVSETLSSGSLIPSHIYNEVGGLNEDLFIDVVDFEYCWRIKRSGYLIIRDFKAKLFHKLGDGRVKILGFLHVGNTAPFRHYYAFRNSVYLILYEKAPFYWKLSNAIKIVFKIGVYPFAFKNGRERFSYMSMGFIDGCRRIFRVIN